MISEIAGSIIHSLIQKRFRSQNVSAFKFKMHSGPLFLISQPIFLTCCGTLDFKTLYVVLQWFVVPLAGALKRIDGLLAPFQHHFMWAKSGTYLTSDIF